MKRLALAGCVVGLLLFGASSAYAETVSLGYQQNTGPHPNVSIFPEDLERAESFVVTITAEPVQPFEYRYYVSCRRGSESVSYQSTATLITAPFTATILPTINEPDSCWMDASAETDFDEDKAGTVKIEVTGNRRPAPAPAPVVSPAPAPTPPAAPVVTIPVPPTWKTCAKPSFLRTGRTEALGETCTRARLVVTTAWRKPVKAGHYVKAYGFSCRRTNHGRSAKVRCAKGTAIVRARGMLPIVFSGGRRDAR